MRRLSLNLLTVSVTIGLLALLTLPAMAVRADGPRAPKLPVPKSRAFGIYIDPWHIDEWATSVGASPTIAAKFEAFSRRRSLLKFTNEATARGIHTVLISWEPWKPVKASLGVFRQSYPQRGYRNMDIASGSKDRYIRFVARGLAKFDGTVYIRYAHEMNGFWYPWSHGPRNYRRAWRHVVTLVRATAPNVRFVWSANLNLYQSAGGWKRLTRKYWPGGYWVDAVGATMINFGGGKHYVVSRFAPRLRALHAAYRKPVLLAETSTEYHGRVVWLRAVRRMLRGMPWIRAVAWSQLPSRGAAQMRGAGRLTWDVQRDPAAAAVVRGIIRDGLR
jgi:mannan endo-1,4-beta-mannosidase